MDIKHINLLIYTSLYTKTLCLEMGLNVSSMIKSILRLGAPILGVVFQLFLLLRFVPNCSYCSVVPVVPVVRRGYASNYTN